MWTPENHCRYDRSRLRYPSDLTDGECSHVAPPIPPAKRGGNKRAVDVREVAADSEESAAAQHRDFELWEWDGTLGDIHHALSVNCREPASREPSRTAAIIDSQSAKNAEKGGPQSTGTAAMRARRSRARSGFCS